MNIKTLSTPLMYSLVALFVGLVLFLNISYWFRDSVFNEQKSVSLIVSALQEESSRDAIAKEITTRALGDLPVLNRLVGNALESRVSDFIAGPLGQPVINSIAKSMYRQISSNQTSVTDIDINPIIRFLIPRLPESMTEFVDKLTEELPKIALSIDAKTDKFYEIGSFFVRFGPLALIGAAIVFAVLMFRSADWRVALRTIGLGVVVAVAVNLALLTTIKEKLSEGIASPNMSVIATNLYTVYATEFESQSYFLIIFGVIAIVIGFLEEPLREGFQAMRLKANSKTKETEKIS